MLRHLPRGFAVAAVAAVALGPVSAAAVTRISACQDLTKAGETYVVTADITASDPLCFRILADRITLDLAGNTITGPSLGSTAGVVDNGAARTLTVVKNGTIKIFGAGIDLRNSTRSTIRNVTVTDSGFGMIVGLNSLVKDCIVQRNSESGIVTNNDVQLEGCLIGGVDSNGNNLGNQVHGLVGGAHMFVTRNTVIGNGFGSIGGFAGISAGDNSTVTHNTANANFGFGIITGLRSLVTQNTSNENGLDGILIGQQSTVTYNVANRNGEIGINGDCPSTVTNNMASENGFGNFGFFDAGAGPCVEKNNTSPPLP